MRTIVQEDIVGEENGGNQFQCVGILLLTRFTHITHKQDTQVPLKMTSHFSRSVEQRLMVIRRQ